MYKLSIVIPTYNRATFLRDTVKSILESMKGHESQVEFLISNNASTDSTEEVIHALMQEHPSLKYFKNEVNVSPDVHFPQAVGRATGEYFWLIGDDDHLEKNAVAEVLERIDQKSNLIICNFSVWSKDFSTELSKSGLDFKNDLKLNDPNLVLKYFDVTLGYISSIIGKKSILQLFNPSELEPFRRFTFPLVYPLYASLLNQCSASYISTPIVRNRSGNTTESSNWFHYYATGTTTIFNGLRSLGYSRNAVCTANNKILIGYVIFVTIEYKLQKIRKPNQWQPLFRSYYSSPLFWLVCVPIIMTPVRILSPFQKQLRKLPALLKKLYRFETPQLA